MKINSFHRATRFSSNLSSQNEVTAKNIGFSFFFFINKILFFQGIGKNSKHDFFINEMKFQFQFFHTASNKENRKFETRVSIRFQFDFREFH
jgi:hypothetical protein